MPMKILLLFIFSLALTGVLAYTLGWRNLGNGQPVVPQKLTASQAVRTNTPPATVNQPAVPIAAPAKAEANTKTDIKP
jgi:hypothetical protein